ncbi:hypothetical protein FH972_025400 [Carpinus fangiana]|uniref:Uncharacterized protein n=1 Tax=Carpinus fangiana TaxID=176857 RepID=A0A5N6L1I3_9ROSI|nr:hypothetical protein FH972_025400 [Carpinus fangiana]
MEFSGAALMSRVTSSNLEIYRERFNFPEGVWARVPRVGEGATSLEGGNEICLSLHILEAGFRLPVPKVIREVLHLLNLAPFQIAPNGWIPPGVSGLLVLPRPILIRLQATINWEPSTIDRSPEGGTVRTRFMIVISEEGLVDEEVASGSEGLIDTNEDSVNANEGSTDVRQQGSAAMNVNPTEGDVVGAESFSGPTSVGSMTLGGQQEVASDLVPSEE